MKSCKTIALCLFLFAVSFESIAQQPSPEVGTRLKGLNLAQLMQVPLSSVATNRAVAVALTPAIVTVITAEDIEKLGARDLVDILRMVPGINFASDVDGNVGISMRGIWANEGKVLLLIDGIEINERMYANVPYGNRVPVHEIEKIEVIRGPASTKYGSFAELGVISITTKRGRTLHGTEAGLTLGQRDQYLSVAAGDMKKGLEWNAIAMVGQGQRSQNSYTDADGQTVSLKGNSAQQPSFFDVGVKKDGLEFRAINDNFNFHDQTAYGQNLVAPVETDFLQFSADLKDRIKLSKSVAITPEYVFKRDEPWRLTDPNGGGFVNGIDFDRVNVHQAFKMRTDWALSEKQFLSLSVENYHERAVDKSGTVFASTNDTSLSFSGWSYALEYELSSKLVNVYLGTRYETNSLFPSSLAPRINLVSQLAPSWVGKILYSQAFRTPTAELVDNSLGVQLNPEKSETFEIEIQHDWSADLKSSLNLFKTTIHDPIIYVTNANAAQFGYVNFSDQGTQGFEVEIKHNTKDIYSYFGISYYQAVDNDVPFFTGVNSSEYQAAPRMKLALQQSYKISENQSLNPSLIWLSGSHGYDYDPTQPAPAVALTATPPRTLASIYFRQQKFLCASCEMGLGVANLFNQDYRLYQAYNSIFPGHPPLPDFGRDIYARFGYSSTF